MTADSAFAPTYDWIDQIVSCPEAGCNYPAFPYARSLEGGWSVLCRSGHVNHAETLDPLPLPTREASAS